MKTPAAPRQSASRHETTAPAQKPRAERLRLELRQEIVAAAFQEFAARGYHQTAIANIAARLGIGHGSVYRHFENKRDILDHVIEDVYSKLRVAMAEGNAPDAATNLEEYRAQIETLGNLLTRIILESPGLFRMLFFEATSIDPEMTKSVLAFSDWCAEQTAAYFENGVKRGFLRKDLDTVATARVVVGMIASTVMIALHADSADRPKRIHDAALRLLVDGIAEHRAARTAKP